MSPYRIALDSTAQTIERRTKHYRRLIICVVLISIGSVTGSIIVGNVLALSGLVWLFPACVLFFYLDGRLLNRWRSNLLRFWVKKELEFRYFFDAVGAANTLPKDTLQGMTSSLPVANDIAIGLERNLSGATRTAIALVISMIDACRSARLACKTIGFTVVAGVLNAVCVFWIWYPLLFLLCLPLLHEAEKIALRLRLKEVQKSLHLVRQNSEFDAHAYSEIIEFLDWESNALPAKEALWSLTNLGESIGEPNNDLY